MWLKSANMRIKGNCPDVDVTVLEGQLVYVP